MLTLLRLTMHQVDQQVHLLTYIILQQLPPFFNKLGESPPKRPKNPINHHPFNSFSANSIKSPPFLKESINKNKLLSIRVLLTKIHIQYSSVDKRNALFEKLKFLERAINS